MLVFIVSKFYGDLGPFVSEVHATSLDEATAKAAADSQADIIIVEPAFVADFAE